MTSSTPVPRKGRTAEKAKSFKPAVGLKRLADWDLVVTAIAHRIYDELRPYVQAKTDTVQQEPTSEEKLAFVRAILGQGSEVNGEKQNPERTQLLRDVKEWHDFLRCNPKEREQDSMLAEIRRIGEAWTAFLEIESDFRAGNWNRVAVRSFSSGWALGYLNSDLKGKAALKGIEKVLGERASVKKRADNADAKEERARAELRRRLSDGKMNMSSAITSMASEFQTELRTVRGKVKEKKVYVWGSERSLFKWCKGINPPK